MEYTDMPETGEVVEQIGKAFVRPMTIIEQYERRIDEHKKEVARLEELVELLKRNPDTKRIFELMGRKGI